MNLKKIYFAGDSFTYGEGLELYTPTDKWRNELHNINRWPELEDKLDSDSIEFRTKNNFVGVFSEKFKNVKTYQSDINGGSLSDVIYHRIPDAITHMDGVDIIVIQFSTFLRNPLHLSYECTCDWCTTTNYGSIGMMNNVLDDAKNDKIYLNDSTLREACKLLDFNDFRSSDMLLKYEEFINTSIKKQLEIFKNNYLNKLIDSGIDVYFIDSWCELTSNYLQRDTDINKLTIPLISIDGIGYRNWKDFEHQFKKYAKIADMYPNTKNFHPTPTVHEYIGYSLIEFFKDKIK